MFSGLEISVPSGASLGCLGDERGPKPTLLSLEDSMAGSA